MCAFQRSFSLLSATAAVFAAWRLDAATIIPPRPDHVVVVIEENKGYSSIIGNAGAPYINALAQNGALFSQSLALTHPSQPNYIALFSGSTHGITTNALLEPINAPNLGGELFAKGLTFGGYSEDLPYTGFTGEASGQYRRKHNPWSNFPDVPASANLPLTEFPADFTQLSTLSIIVPNQDNDMHDGTIETGDAWLSNRLDAYAQWAMTHNSLLVLTFDEDDGSQNNRVATIFYGPMVKPGVYDERITHYTVLRTLQEMYRLAPIEESNNATPILDVWTHTLSSPEFNTDGQLVGNQGDPLSFDIRLSGSDPIVLSATRLPDFLTLNGRTLSGVPDAPGSFNFDITATNYVASESLTFRLKVLPNTAPAVTVQLDVPSPKTNDTLMAMASPSDADNDPVLLTYVWKVNGAIRKTTTQSASLIDSFDLSVPGNGDHGDIVSVEVTPNDGLIDGAVATAFATVANTAPVLSSFPSALPSVAGIGQTIIFTAAAADADGDPLSYTWDFGDGSAAPGVAANHAFASAGTYLVKLSIGDAIDPPVVTIVPVAVVSTAEGISHARGLLRFGRKSDLVILDATVKLDGAFALAAGNTVTVRIGGLIRQVIYTKPGPAVTKDGRWHFRFFKFRSDGVPVVRVYLKAVGALKNDIFGGLPLNVPAEQLVSIQFSSVYYSKYFPITLKEVNGGEAGRFNTIRR